MDDHDPEEISQKCHGALEFLQQVYVPLGNCIGRCKLQPQNLISDVDDPNYRTQNDFRFAIVSADDLDSGENSKKWPSVVEIFILVLQPRILFF